MYRSSASPARPKSLIRTSTRGWLAVSGPRGWRDGSAKGRTHGGQGKNGAEEEGGAVLICGWLRDAGLQGRGWCHGPDTLVSDCLDSNPSFSHISSLSHLPSNICFPGQ